MMMLTDYRFPGQFRDDLIRAAIEVCDVAPTLKGEELLRLFPQDGIAAIGMCGKLKSTKDGDYCSVSFKLSVAPDTLKFDEFHVFVPFSQGYEKAKDDLLERASHFWLLRTADQFIAEHGRVFASFGQDAGRD